MTIAVVVAVARAAALVVAAYFDNSLWLPGEGVGLFEHPGVLAIVVGDAVLFLLCVYASRMTRSVGRRLPTDRRPLVQRYFRLIILRSIFDRGGSFSKMLLFLSVIGALSLVNQTIQLTDASAYYGHDTFDSILHRRSFWVMRVNLFISWCIIIPLLSSYLIAHTKAIRLFFRRCDGHGLVKFQPGHPDQHGGFTFFGWLDTIYAIGLLTVLIEVFLLIITHRRVTAGNLFSLMGITVGGVLISVLSIYEVVRVVRRQERLLKMAAFVRTVRGSRQLSQDYLALVYDAKFSPYSRTALRLAVALRAAALIPVAIRAMTYITSKL
ncbi:MAG TPA: hypothetical protein VF240_17195 [Pyrinomonadaceae bacterium]